jgi:multidrug transporter EmrE-like cation transporter
LPFSVQLGLLMAFVTAFMSVLGFLLKERGAVLAAPVEWRRPLASAVALFRSPMFALGCVVATTSWGFHVAALALAPISLVQSVIAGGLVLVTVLADRVFGHDVSRREWIGVALTAAGLAVLAATLEGAGDSAHADYGGWELGLYVGLATLAGLALVVLRGAGGLALAVSAGLLWAGSDVTIKALSGKTGDLGAAVLVHPFALVILVLSLVGLLVSARSLQIGPVVPVIALTSTTANALTIAAGPVVFGEPLPEEPLALALRLGAFALVIGAATMTPPVRAAAPA